MINIWHQKNLKKFVKKQYLHNNTTLFSDRNFPKKFINNFYVKDYCIKHSERSFGQHKKVIAWKPLSTGGRQR